MSFVLKVFSVPSLPEPNPDSAAERAKLHGGKYQRQILHVDGPVFGPPMPTEAQERAEYERLRVKFEEPKR